MTDNEVQWRSPETAPLRRVIRIKWCDFVITRGYRFVAGNNGVRWYDDSTNSTHEEDDVLGWSYLDGEQ